jgi:neutral ceramidase
MTLVSCGVATVDVTPPVGLRMAGFAARIDPAQGAHDPLTVRALAVGETAIAVADVIGLDDALCARVRARLALADGAVILAATHTHGGPMTLPGRFGVDVDAAWLARLEDGFVDAIGRALADRRPATVTLAHGADPGVAKNRRHAGGLTDPSLPVVRVTGADGRVVAVLVAYACHPVVLGADNRLWTADYPGFVRRRIEAAAPGATALFLTGCCGDANTGHSAAASLTRAAAQGRTYEAAEGYAARIADAALAARPSVTASGPARGASSAVRLDFVREARPVAELAADWRAERASATDPVRAVVLDHWIAWAEGAGAGPLTPYDGRVGVLDWGGIRIAGLPGEIFAETGLSVRAGLDGRPTGGGTIAIAYADGCPGYIPPLSEIPHGGYEVAEAHRYFATPGPFAPGSAERLAEAAVRVGQGLGG